MKGIVLTDKSISAPVTFRPVSMFAPDMEANKEKLTEEIKGKKVCVIGGAGSIGSSFIKAVLCLEPKGVRVADLGENGPAELVRDVRSTEGRYVKSREMTPCNSVKYIKRQSPGYVLSEYVK